MCQFSWKHFRSYFSECENKAEVLKIYYNVIKYSLDLKVLGSVSLCLHCRWHAISAWQLDNAGWRCVVNGLSFCDFCRVGENNKCLSIRVVSRKCVNLCIFSESVSAISILSTVSRRSIFAFFSFSHNNAWSIWSIPLTLSSWYQNIEPGGSGPNRIVHVKLIWLPLSTYRSGPPKIVAIGSAHASGKPIWEKK